LDNHKKLPSRQELEEELSRLREVSSGIDRMTKLLVSGEVPAIEVKKKIGEYVAKQSHIVDNFIEYSQDLKSLKKFAEIVGKIETKTELLGSCEDSEEYQKLKKEVLDHIDEWISCLEIIIIGVINRAPV